MHQQLIKETTEWNEEQEEFARHKRYTLHTGHIKMKGRCGDVHCTNFFRSYVPTEAVVNNLAIHTKGRMYNVDSGASLHMMGSSSWTDTERKTIRQASAILDIQTANGIAVSGSHAKLHIKELGMYPWEL